jgi:hypothetical protein
MGLSLVGTVLISAHLEAATDHDGAFFLVLDIRQVATHGVT